MDQSRSDAIHFDVPGYQAIGSRFALAARALVYGEPLQPLTRPLGASAGAGGTSIEIDFDADVQGGDAALFRVRDAVSAPVVLQATTSAARVTLRLDRALVAPAFASYGFAVDPWAPWVVDRGLVPVPCFRDLPVAP